MQTTRSAPEKQAEYDKMANAPVGGLIVSLAVPTMVTTLIMSVYNMADTFFVGRIGTSATAAEISMDHFTGTFTRGSTSISTDGSSTRGCRRKLPARASSTAVSTSAMGLRTERTA